MELANGTTTARGPYRSGRITRDGADSKESPDRWQGSQWGENSISSSVELSSLNVPCCCPVTIGNDCEKFSRSLVARRRTKVTPAAATQRHQTSLEAKVSNCDKFLRPRTQPGNQALDRLNHRSDVSTRVDLTLGGPAAERARCGAFDC